MPKRKNLFANHPKDWHFPFITQKRQKDNSINPPISVGIFASWLLTKKLFGK